MAQPAYPTPVAVSKEGLMTIPAKAHRHQRLLAAGVAETFSVPLSENGTLRATDVVFASTEDIYVAYTLTGEGDNTAVVPVADITDGTAMDLNPQTRNLLGVIKISVISESACKVALTFFIQ